MDSGKKGMLAAGVLGFLAYLLYSSKAAGQGPVTPTPFRLRSGDKVVTTRRTGWYGDPNPNTQGMLPNGEGMTVPTGIILTLIDDEKVEGWLNVMLTSDIADVLFDTKQVMTGWVVKSSTEPGEGVDIPVARV